MGKYFVDGLTKQQIETFEQITIGNDKGVHPRVADNPIKKGLIEKQFQDSGRVIIYRYVVLTHIHVQWCAWCAKQKKSTNN